MSEYLEAAERYARLAMKAQGNWRATLEALVDFTSRASKRCDTFTSMTAGKLSLPINSTITRGLPKMANQSNNPMQPERLASAPRCLARTRMGTECQSPAVKGKRRCRMHGGTNPGAPKGNRNAYKHGGRSAATMAAATYLRTLAQLISDDE